MQPLFSCAFEEDHVPGPEPPSAVHTAHCSRVRSMCGGCFSGVELFDKNKLQAVAVSSSESLLGFHPHSWMFLGLPVRDGCDMGTGDETGLPRHTNTALHSRPCVQLVGMTQEAQGLLSPAEAAVQVSVVLWQSSACRATEESWPTERRPLGRCCGSLWAGVLCVNVVR